MRPLEAATGAGHGAAFGGRSGVGVTSLQGVAQVAMTGFGAAPAGGVIDLVEDADEHW